MIARLLYVVAGAVIGALTVIVLAATDEAAGTAPIVIRVAVDPDTGLPTTINEEDGR